MRRMLCAALAAAVVFPATVAVADDTGFASMHDLRKERGRQCMTDHWHNGEGSGKTKRAALREAIKSYWEYTAFEYGSDWARWSRAGSKRVKYTKETSGWSASVEARPCR